MFQRLSDEREWDTPGWRVSVGGWSTSLGLTGSLSCPWRGNPASQKQGFLLLRLHRRQKETLSLGISICHLFWLVHYREISQKPTDEWGGGRNSLLLLPAEANSERLLFVGNARTGLLLHNSLVSLSGNEVETGPAARKLPGLLLCITQEKSERQLLLYWCSPSVAFFFFFFLSSQSDHPLKTIKPLLRRSFVCLFGTSHSMSVRPGHVTEFPFAVRRLAVQIQGPQRWGLYPKYF